MNRPRPQRLVWILLPFVVVACAEPPVASRPEPSGQDPAELALWPFHLGHEPQLESVDLSRWFDLAPSESDHVALLEALDRLAGTPPPQLLTLERAADTREAFADLETALPGGGQASFSVKLRQQDDGIWRIDWLQGPGIEWPALPAGRNHSLSVSSHPRGDGE